ncbi:Fe3+-siderophore ABC transporter permease [Rhodanobacter sp. FW510-R12]|nr:Fe3+-siderophore ABC transporter permease [Rhodanobacter sp. FW104-R8]KZC28376.1 Fe3+-siderophore ABC transporter permease [Rhodanobacter sp. FW510-T8]KZC32752.1 Fe3+-siderophore ABC transporter permease [Rhodanobacter sp. FW510-R10]
MVSMGLGRYRLPIQTVIDVLWSALANKASGYSPAIENVVLAVRLPRVLAAMLVGASLAGAGAAYQTLFRNPLASPAILGVSSGAGFGAALAMLLGGGALAVQGFSFAGGICAVGTAIFIAGHLGKDSALVLVLAGLVVSALFQALTSATKYLADPLDTLPTIVFWLLGSLGRVTASDLYFAAPFSALGIVALFLLRWPTQVLEAGDDEARTLGVPVRWLRVMLIVAATLMTAAAVSISGIVGWIGLLVPHLGRLMIGPAYARLLPASILLGAGFLLLVDDLCRSAFATELPLGIVTAILGAPVFVIILARARRQ